MNRVPVIKKTASSALTTLYQRPHSSAIRLRAWLNFKSENLRADTEIPLNESDIDISRYSPLRVIWEIVRQTRDPSL
jgi:hypothetical protein